jgi:hypothetical protein
MTVSNNHSFSLHNIELFKKIFDTPLNHVIEKYSNLVNEYINFICENIQIRTKPYTRFIIIRGFDTITNVFNHILYYTKNIDLAYFHSQKSFYFYVEFIGQISNDQNTFLQLSSRDAIIYVYKKTLFEINNEYRKKFVLPTLEEQEKYIGLNEYVKIYKLIFTKMIGEEDFLLHENKKKYLIENHKINQKINDTNMNPEQLAFFQLFINKLLTFSTIKTDSFFECLLLMLKKIKNKTIHKEKLYLENFELYLHESNTKLINWLTTIQ